MLEQISTTAVSEINLREPVRASPSARLFEVVVQIREQRRGAALIEDNSGHLIGIFTERDLMLRVDHRTPAWHDIAVSEVMTREPVTVDASASMADALECMSKGGFRNLPVLDASGRAHGLVSIRDILSHLVEFFPNDFINLPPDPDREASGRWGG